MSFSEEAHSKFLAAPPEVQETILRALTKFLMSGNPADLDVLQFPKRAKRVTQKKERPPIQGNKIVSMAEYRQRKIAV